MKNWCVGSLVALALLMFGCSLDNSNLVEPVIIDPPSLTIISSDTLVSGQYLGIVIGGKAELIYQEIQKLPVLNPVNLINIVGNFVTDFPGLQERLPLYSYFWLDESAGTDSGVQVSLEGGKVTSIFLSSGKALSQWPSNANSDASLRVGDMAGTLYAKLAKIKSNQAYSKKFERVMLLTKNLSLAFDPETALSPQWYFAYKTADNLLEEVQVNFKNGVAVSIVVNKYQN